MAKYKYNWRPSLPQLGRETYQIPQEHLVSAPASLVTLEKFLFPAVDQGQLGSCTGNGTAGAMKVMLTEQGYKWPFFPSRLFLYYNARIPEGTTMTDSGATIADVVAGANKYGVCPENTGTAWNWAYSDNSVNFRIKPWTQCYQNATLHEALKTQLVPQDRAHMVSVIAQGMPIIIGISVYSSFESSQVAATGIVPMPNSSESLLGGHCLFVYGIDQAKDVALVRNSWGQSWGRADQTGRGSCQIPMEYLCNTNLASDFHAISLIGAGK